MIKVKPPRWIEPRKEMPKKLSIEMIMRKSFKSTMSEYISNCSLAGVRQMCDPNIGVCQRSVWLGVFLAAVSMAFYYLWYVWGDTLGRPLIVSKNSLNFPIAGVSFPAIAICNINRISKKAMSDFAREIYPKVSKSKRFFEKDYPIELVENFVLQWGRLIDFSYNESVQNHPIFKSMVELYRDDTAQVIDIMKRLSPQCGDMVVKCSFSGEVGDCRNMFAMRRTMHGHCCTFNFLFDHDPYGQPIKVPSPVKRQSEPGRSYGLNVILDTRTHDYAYPMAPIHGFNILTFYPFAYPDPSSGRVIRRIVQPNTALFMEISAIYQLATAETRKYSLKTRKCYFPDENEEYNEMYSYSSCIVKCRVNTLYSLCKCVPYFLAKFSSSPIVNICTIDDLRCLNKYKEKLLYLYPYDAGDRRGLEMEMQESLDCEGCLPGCEKLRYFTKSYEIPTFIDGHPHKQFKYAFLKGIDMQNKSLLSIYYKLPDTTLDRLEVVSYWFEILSNIGGFCGIAVGFSFVTFIELIFFLFIRFPQLFYENFKKYHY